MVSPSRPMRTMPDRRLHRHDGVRDDAGKRRAGRIGDVRRDNSELGFREARAEGGLGNVELVVPERRPVEPEQVQDGHHLTAVEPFAVHARRPERRRRQVVAAEGRDQPGFAGLEPRAKRRHARKAPGLASVHGRDLVHVVEMKDRDRRGRGLPVQQNARKDDRERAGEQAAHRQTIADASTLSGTALAQGPHFRDRFTIHGRGRT